MKDSKRREEYLLKARELYEEYLTEDRAFMERRRRITHPALDQGAAEEQAIRKRYKEKAASLAEEYKDLQQHAESLRSLSERD